MSLTSDFYDSDPEGYFDRTFGADMSDARSRFVACLDPGASILDLGCGSCRDTVAFRDAGFDVTPADGSEGMRRVVRERLGIEVVPVDIADMRLGRTFDGIWACASLLHVPSAELPGVMRSIRAMLRPGGAFFCCFKLGTFEGIRDGRFYTDMTEGGLRTLLEGAGFAVRGTWVSDGDGCRWINAISVA